MTSFLGLCLTAFVLLPNSAENAPKSEAVFYEWRLQYWEWETKDLHPDTDKVPKGAKLTEVVFQAKPGEEGFVETQMGDRTIGLGLYNVSPGNEPGVRVVYHVTNKGKLLKRTRSGGSAGETGLLVKTMKFGQKISLGSAAHRPGDGQVTYCNTSTCTIEKKTRRDFLRAIKAHSLPEPGLGDLP